MIALLFFLIKFPLWGIEEKVKILNFEKSKCIEFENNLNKCKRSRCSYTFTSNNKLVRYSLVIAELNENKKCKVFFSRKYTDQVSMQLFLFDDSELSELEKFVHIINSPGDEKTLNYESEDCCANDSKVKRYCNIEVNGIKILNVLDETVYVSCKDRAVKFFPLLQRKINLN